MVEIIPKQKQKPLFGQWFFLIASVLLLGGVAVGFFVLDQLEKNAREILEGLEETLAADTQPQEQAIVAELNEYKEKIDRFREAAAEREDFLPLFVLLEQSILDGVVLSRLESERGSNKIFIEGVADSFFVLEQQRLLWKQQEQIGKTDIRNMNLEQEGQVQFEAELML